MGADMTDDTRLIEVWRGGRIESVHRGHAVVCDAAGEIIHQWGNPSAVIFPRSSSKMIQALPLITSGAADAFGLRTDQLALSCASHLAASYHTDPVQTWLADLGLTDDAFRCGPQEPNDKDQRNALLRDHQEPCRYHNNCSGKHCGFLTLGQHLGAGPDYIAPDHPVQVAVLDAFEEVTGETSPGYGIDGCSSPNHACTLHGLARAMSRFATASDRSDSLSVAQARLTNAMMQHPELVRGNGHACTELMRAAPGDVALKTGADGVYIAILPSLKMGVALKITDGAQRASEPAIAAILHKLGVIAEGHPMLDKFMTPKVRNFAGLETGWIQPAF